MISRDERDVDWILSNLFITHKYLGHREAFWWYLMKERDQERFARLALLGYVMRKDKYLKIQELTDDEVNDFLTEFVCKIFLAFSRNRDVPALPLFDIAGIDLNENLLTYQGHTYILQPCN